MNQKSLAKIQAAAHFLSWFRHYLPQNMQNLIRPYLDQPYQLALKILDCCNDSNHQTVEEIANAAQISKSTARQVINAMREGGVIFAVGNARSWRPVEVVRPEPEEGSSEWLSLAAGVIPGKDNL